VASQTTGTENYWEQKSLQRKAAEKVSSWSSVCCLTIAQDVPAQAEFPAHTRPLWNLPTWTNEDIFHRQHGCYGKQQIFTVKRSSFYDSTAQVGREGKLHQEFTQSCHVASPYPRKKIQTPGSMQLCLNVNRNMHTQCHPPHTDKEHGRSIVLWTVPTPQSVCAQIGAGDVKQVSLAEEHLAFLQFAYVCLTPGKASFLKVSDA